MSDPPTPMNILLIDLSQDTLNGWFIQTVLIPVFKGHSKIVQHSSMEANFLQHLSNDLLILN